MDYFVLLTMSLSSGDGELFDVQSCTSTPAAGSAKKVGTTLVPQPSPSGSVDSEDGADERTLESDQTFRPFLQLVPG